MADDIPVNKPNVPPVDLVEKPKGNLLAGKKATLQEATKAAGEFESMFLAQMLAPMWAGIGGENYLGGGAAEETYRGMLVNEYGKMVSKSGGLGIADSVKTELIRLQEEKKS